MLRHRWFRLLAAWTMTLVSVFMLIGCKDTDHPKAKDMIPVVTAEQRLILDQMNEAAEGAYQSVREGDLKEALERVERLSVLSTRLSYEGIANAEGMQAVSQAITEAERTLHDLAPEHHQVSMSVAKARLTVDALAHKEQPMWLGFRRTLAEDLKKLGEAAAAENKESATAALDVWKAHVSMIHPAIVVSRDASAAVRLSSITAFLENGISSSNWNGLNQAMPNLLAAMEDVFRSPSSGKETIAPMTPTAEPPHPFLWSLALGSFIVTVLTYVAWRRYRAEEGVSRVKRERDIDGGI